MQFEIRTCEGKTLSFVRASDVCTAASVYARRLSRRARAHLCRGDGKRNSIFVAMVPSRQSSGGETTFGDPFVVIA